jgi:choline-glycine betaine transporter
MDDTAVNGLPENQKGVSNTTIAVLIILALVMTIIGTLAVISGNNTGINQAPKHSSATNIGKVYFQITPPPSPETTPVAANQNGQ